MYPNTSRVIFRDFYLTSHFCDCFRVRRTSTVPSLPILNSHTEYPYCVNFTHTVLTLPILYPLYPY